MQPRRLLRTPLRKAEARRELECPVWIMSSGLGAAQEAPGSARARTANRRLAYICAVSRRLLSARGDPMHVQAGDGFPHRLIEGVHACIVAGKPGIGTPPQFAGQTGAADTQSRR